MSLDRSSRPEITKLPWEDCDNSDFDDIGSGTDDSPLGGRERFEGSIGGGSWKSLLGAEDGPGIHSFNLGDSQARGQMAGTPVTIPRVVVYNDGNQCFTGGGGGCVRCASPSDTVEPCCVWF